MEKIEEFNALKEKLENHAHILLKTVKCNPFKLLKKV
jgi:Txe/YoeB family toxin of Txe-Axe toxin-antitoxin module